MHKEEKKAEKASIWRKIYFLVLGFNSTLFLTLLITTMHFFKARFSSFKLSFIVLVSIKLTILISIFPVVWFRKFSLSFQVLTCSIGMIGCFLATFKVALFFPDSGFGLGFVILFLVMGALFQFQFQANALRVVTFYGSECVAIFYSAAVLIVILCSLIAFTVLYITSNQLLFMLTFSIIGGGTVAVFVLSHLILRVTPYYIRMKNEHLNSEAGSFASIAEGFQRVKYDFWTIMITLTLTSITMSTIFFEIRPTIFPEPIWINGINLAEKVIEVFGRYTGAFPLMEPIVTQFYWFPWVYNVIIIGVYLLGNQQVYDTFWNGFVLILLFLFFRS